MQQTLNPRALASNYSNSGRHASTRSSSSTGSSSGGSSSISGGSSSTSGITSSGSSTSSRMRRQLADAKARLRTRMLAVRSQHLLMQQLQQQHQLQQQQQQPEGRQPHEQQEQQLEQQKVAECLALQHLDGQLDKLLRVLHSLFPGTLRGAQGDTGEAATATATTAESVSIVAEAAVAAQKAAAGEAAAAGSAAAVGARPLRVGGYYSIGSEYCCLPLLERLWSLGAEVSLPVCPPKGRLLQFRLYHPREALQPGKYGIPCPRGDRLHPEVSPEVLLVPLLAFDAAGRRLGYGGGFYDATIAALKAAAAPAAAAAAAVAAPAGAIGTPAELLSRLRSTGTLRVTSADTAGTAASPAADGQSLEAAAAAGATAAANRSLGKPLICGVGFGCQEVAEGTLPLELHDELLDLVLAEEHVRIFNPRLASIQQ
ncbi:hypothetical protein Emag_001492 [Eimeria magna]